MAELGLWTVYQQSSDLPQPTPNPCYAPSDLSLPIISVSTACPTNILSPPDKQHHVTAITTFPVHHSTSTAASAPAGLAWPSWKPSTTFTVPPITAPPSSPSEADLQWTLVAVLGHGSHALFTAAAVAPAEAAADDDSSSSSPGFKIYAKVAACPTWAKHVPSVAVSSAAAAAAAAAAQGLRRTSQAAAQTLSKVGAWLSFGAEKHGETETAAPAPAAPTSASDAPAAAAPTAASSPASPPDSTPAPAQNLADSWATDTWSLDAHAASPEVWSQVHPDGQAALVCTTTSAWCVFRARGSWRVQRLPGKPRSELMSGCWIPSTPDAAGNSPSGWQCVLARPGRRLWLAYLSVVAEPPASADSELLLVDVKLTCKLPSSAPDASSATQTETVKLRVSHCAWAGYGCVLAWGSKCVLAARLESAPAWPGELGFLAGAKCKSNTLPWLPTLAWTAAGVLTCSLIREKSSGDRALSELSLPLPGDTSALAAADQGCHALRWYSQVCAAAAGKSSEAAAAAAAERRAAQRAAEEIERTKAKAAAAAEKAKRQAEAEAARQKAEAEKAAEEAKKAAEAAAAAPALQESSPSKPEQAEAGEQPTDTPPRASASASTEPAIPVPPRLPAWASEPSPVPAWDGPAAATASGATQIAAWTNHLVGDDITFMDASLPARLQSSVWFQGRVAQPTPDAAAGLTVDTGRTQAAPSATVLEHGSPGQHDASPCSTPGTLRAASPPQSHAGIARARSASLSLSVGDDADLPAMHFGTSPARADQLAEQLSPAGSLCAQRGGSPVRPCSAKLPVLQGAPASTYTSQQVRAALQGMMPEPAMDACQFIML